ncbi:2,6-dioxo-6-phenylhexa-3-enoate hydrolase protein [Dioscorea alata]|uniref:2,6-dioxo-6-phenylhexa-3-enoate hydrolase protein n=1 Tax=Dioscorea alata TaxID=55571 RepID=A0ACB7U1F9_DIOAL|nr:2,6-dioxo-6-phenylhexa-3-enoate hydrolase protein [Dioscorea alata]
MSFWIPTSSPTPDSTFSDIHGVRVHHKVCHHDDGHLSRGSLNIGLPLVLLHGFGASVFSWSRVMRPLARIAGSKVLAFDRPAFGLTARSAPVRDNGALNPYSMAFAVLATLSFIDMLGSQKAILIGHSAGCLVAVNAYFEAPERIAALILVAPAIVAPLLSWRGKDGKIRKENNMGGGKTGSNDRKNPLVGIWRALLKMCMFIVGMAMRMLEEMRDMVRLVYAKVLAAVLRSSLAVMLVRMVIDKFGIPAIRNSWYDASQIAGHVLQGYTKPLRCKGWDMALLEYTIAMLTDSAAKSKPPLTRRLAEISCPVLIVTGDTDRLVPSWNAERLSMAIPGSTFEVIRKCGHLPHEERVDEFLSVIERFLQKVFGVSEGYASSNECTKSEHNK